MCGLIPVYIYVVMLILLVLSSTTVITNITCLLIIRSSLIEELPAGSRYTNQHSISGILSDHLIRALPFDASDIHVNQTNTYSFVSVKALLRAVQNAHRTGLEPFPPLMQTYLSSLSHSASPTLTIASSRVPDTSLSYQDPSNGFVSHGRYIDLMEEPSDVSIGLLQTFFEIYSRMHIPVTHRVHSLLPTHTGSLSFANVWSEIYDMQRTFVLYMYDTGSGLNHLPHSPDVISCKLNLPISLTIHY